jgi:hypothetical protein
MDKPLPSQLRDGACWRAPAGLFDIPPRGSHVGPRGSDTRTRGERRRRNLQIAVALSFCNGTLLRPRCELRAQCLAWALRASETGVYGGILVTTGTLRRREAVLKEQEERRAAEEKGAPPHRRGQLAEQPREAG